MTAGEIAGSDGTHGGERYRPDQSGSSSLRSGGAIIQRDRPVPVWGLGILTGNGVAWVNANLDIAVFNASNEVGARGITTTARSTWSTAHAAASNYTPTNAAKSAANVSSA